MEGEVFEACKQNDTSVLKRLGVDSIVSLVDKDGYTPLHIACKHNSIDVAKLLIERGANVNAHNNGTTILHSACEGGYYQMSSILLRKGANVNAVDKRGRVPLNMCKLNEENTKLYVLVFLSGMEGTELNFVAAYTNITVDSEEEKFKAIISIIVDNLSHKKALDLANRELAYFTPSELISFDKLKVLNLSYNYFTNFTSNLAFMSGLTSLNLSHNYITVIPPQILIYLPHLQIFDISYNNIETVSSDLLELQDLDISNNPISGVPSHIRSDKNKLLFFLKYEGKRQAWNQVKVMLVGHEGVGKTTLLKSLQGQQAPANKGINISTNGVDISHVEFSLTPNESRVFKLPRKKEKVVLNVWDFGGQAVFHNTHCFFLTSSAIYIVIFSMADENTHSRLEHWMQQISSIIDVSGNSMPVLIVGTHSDRLTQREQERVLHKVAKAYPISKKTTGVQGHYAVSLSTKSDSGLQNLKEAIVDIARTHPKLGIGNVMVPSFLVMIKEKLEEMQEEKKYLAWQEYKELCQDVAMVENLPVVEWTQILQELGVVIWHNTASLRDIVIINPQWLADALAGVVTMVNQESIARAGGVAPRNKLYNVMKNKIPDPILYPIILELLERFEIILRMRNYYSGVQELVETDAKQDDDVKYFVPSLLLPFDPIANAEHPAIEYWNKLRADPRRIMLKRRFSWSYYPSNFFPRLLLRFMHMQLLLLGSWVDAVVIMNQEQEQYGFLKFFSRDGSFILEVSVIQNSFMSANGHTRESLISELAYAISHLDRDTDTSETHVMQHNVIVTGTNEEGIACEMEVPFEQCMGMISQDQRVLRFANQHIAIESVVPDLSSCTLIQNSSLSDIAEIGRGGFGIVYKATMRDANISKVPVTVAYKEIQKDPQADDDPSEESRRFHEFQHEMLIMSKVKHKNLVELFGIIKSPLSLVMEFVPCGDLFKLLHTQQSKFASLPLKWKLKLAIDIARGVSHLHKQTPPVCHSDLRAPNIFIASFDAEAPIVGKVADFGLAQQVFPFSSQVLHNTMETAPETWGDEGITRSVMYDERCDVFSYAILLWCLFGVSPTKSNNTVEYNFNPYCHLRDSKGRALNPFVLRNKIREGARPIISRECPLEMRKLIESCWQSSPTMRPYFPLILHSLYSIYTKLAIGPESYLDEDLSTVTEKVETSTIGTALSSKATLVENNWNPRPNIGAMSAAVVSLLYIGDEIWAGTNCGTILVASAVSGRLEYAITVGKGGRVSLLQVSKYYLWVSCETELIFMINTQTRCKIMEIDNEFPVTCMSITYHHAGPKNPVVWVADTQGCISLWDLMTIHKYIRFQVITGVNPPVVRHMDILNKYMWMAVGGDIVAIETQTLQRIVQPSGSTRLNCITVVSSTQEIWTCAKDGKIKVWKLQGDGTNIKELKCASYKAEVKFVQPIHSLARGHVVTGDFNGKLFIWNSKTFDDPEEFPMPAESNKHSLQCAIDTSDCGLWVGSMNLLYPLLRYHWIKRPPKIGQSRLRVTN